MLGETATGSQQQRDVPPEAPVGESRPDRVPPIFDHLDELKPYIQTWFREFVNATHAESANQSPSTTDSSMAAISTAAVAAMELAVQQVDRANKTLQEQLNSKWEWPKYLMVAATVGITFFFGVNLWQQFVTVSELQKQAATLREQLKQNDTENEEDKLLFASDEVRVAIERRTNTCSHRVLSLMDIAREQVHTRSSYRRALQYGNQAKALIDTTRNENSSYARSAILSRLPSRELEFIATRTDPVIADAEESLLVADGLVASLQCECIFHLQEVYTPGDLEESASRIVESKCGCLEGHFYLGLAYLLRAKSATTEADSHSWRAKARSEFEAAVGGTGAENVSILFVCLVNLIDGQFADVKRDCDLFMKEIPNSMALNRLSPEEQARVWLATAMKAVAGYVMDGEMLPDALKCSVDPAVLGIEECALFEWMFRNVIQQRSTFLGEERSCDILGEYCLASMQSLIRARCFASESEGGTCRGCSAESSSADDEALSHDLLLEYGLTHRVRLPKASRDASLGHVLEDGSVLMTVAIAKLETRTASKQSRDGVITDYTYGTEILATEERTFPNRDAIRLDTYVPSVPAPAPAPAPPAPATEPS